MLTHTNVPIETLHTNVLKFINGRRWLRRVLPKRAIQRVKRCKRAGFTYQWAISLRALLKLVSRKVGVPPEVFQMSQCATRLIEESGPMVGYSDGDSSTIDIEEEDLDI